MIVLVVSECPSKLRGDLSKWLLEINSGVYVGNINARIREELWGRVVENIGHGRATMVFHSNNEQYFDFKIHNSTWEPVDFDGLSLIKRPSSINRNVTDNFQTVSRASSLLKRKSIQTSFQQKISADDYVVVDIETTGLSFDEDRIIEIAAILIKEGTIVNEFSTLISSCDIVPSEITYLTGITTDMIHQYGVPPSIALTKFLEFIGDYRIVCHNANFDLTFLNIEFKRLGMKLRRRPISDTLILAKKKVSQIKDYKLSSIAMYLEIPTESIHRALSDCYLTYKIYEKLNGL